MEGQQVSTSGENVREVKMNLLYVMNKRVHHFHQILGSLQCNTSTTRNCVYVCSKVCGRVVSFL